jgi:hypothetical protein
MFLHSSSGVFFLAEARARNKPEPERESSEEIDLLDDMLSSLVELLEERGMKDRFLLLVGGAIATKDFEPLKELGAANIYGPGSLIKDIVEFIKEHVQNRFPPHFFLLF